MTPCELCKGACCEGILLQLPRSDLGKWLMYHGRPIDDKVYLDCKCTKLKDGRCSIYEDRPQVCKDYEVGSKACLSAIKRNRSNYQGKKIKALICNSKTSQS